MHTRLLPLLVLRIDNAYPVLEEPMRLLSKRRPKFKLTE